MNSKGGAVRGSLVIAILAAVVLLAAYWPTLRWLVISWLSSDYYSYGFLVPLVSAGLTWTLRRRLKRQAPSALSLPVLGLAAALYGAGLIWHIRILGALSLTVLLAGLVISLFGTKAVRALAFPLVFLVFMIPFPMVTDLAFRLQPISVHASTWLLRLAGLPVSSSGAEIHLNDIIFTVGIVCSGIDTLVALVSLGAVYAYALTGSVFKRIGLVVIAFPVAVAGNILRISSIIAIAHFFSLKAATGWYHNLSSAVFFFIEFLILILIARLMKCGINYRLFNRR